MKTDIHPQYFTEAVITCANCKHEFKTGAARKEMTIEICSQCHPFFTGKKVLIDTEGRVDKFRQKMDKAGGRKKKVRKKKTLEEKVNEEIAAQLGIEKQEEEKKALKAEKKEAAPAPEAPVAEETPATNEAPAEENTEATTEEA
jgi:large subunit ribosomal protein L31